MESSAGPRNEVGWMNDGGGVRVGVEESLAFRVEMSFFILR